MYLVGGLGNPGQRYRNSRHNIGFRVVNEWCRSLGVQMNGRRFQSRNTLTRFQDQEIVLLRPLTFMNLSGRSIRACADFYDLKPQNILIVHDDVDLPVGRIRVVKKGGAGGHKGVLSIVHHLGTKEFPRIKIGVGRPRYAESIEDYVLGPFYRDEKEIMGKTVQVAVKACGLLICDGVEAAMNQTNCQNLADKEVCI